MFQESLLIALFIIGGVAVIIGLIFLSFHLEKRKREAFQLVASQLGLNYSPEQDRGMASRYIFLDKLNAGSNQYTSHVLSGTFQGHAVMAFDYHYETYSTDSKGNRTTHHYNFSVFIAPLPRPFPEMTIRPEGFFSKIAQAVGYDDIDFESAEFSRRYCVRSEDKRFAYDICHPIAIEFLLDQPDLDIEIEGATLAAIESGSLTPERVKPMLERLLAFRRLLPEHLLKA